MSGNWTDNLVLWRIF